VSVTVNHGNDPMPNTAQLVDCLKDAACDALKDFLESEMNSSAFELETEHLEEDILRLEEEKLRSDAGDAAGKLCGKLLD